ncbi:exodeoxyribonuclease V subunit gamma [Halomonas sp. WWR20]
MFTVLHANHLEDLRDLALALIGRQPLPPLVDETFLVQSNGMAQWLRIALAEKDGIAAAVDFPLPSSFVWRAYRAVLGDQIPLQSPFDKGPMTWRLMRLLPGLLTHEDFAPLAHYLHDDRDGAGEGRKTWQLAAKLADLFDQYLVYRPDWIAAWEAEEPAPADLPDDQRWQPILWRALLDDAPQDERQCHRAALHRQFLDRARSLDTSPAGLPPRLFVFGISALPAQTLEALHALSGVMDVVLMITNPCRYYWGDVVADRDAIKRLGRLSAERTVRHPEAPRLEGVDGEGLHLRANPLLAGWGTQGRDFIVGLYEFESAHPFDLETDAFRDVVASDAGSPETPLLSQLQQEILDLVHPGERAEEEGGPREIAADDRSLSLVSAHSPLREVEILHDRLLEAFERDPSLKPRDVIVMVPDIDRYAPFIDAVFGQVPASDPRYIPFTIADRLASQADPLMACVLHLLELPQRRLGVSEILDALDVPAFRRRFDIEAHELDRLRQWLAGSGVRWGLDSDHRGALGLPDLHGNTWAFGLERMLLGYAVGQPSAEAYDFDGIAPYDEVGGLEADLAGRLASLIQTLERQCRLLRSEATPQQWVVRLRELVEACIQPQDAVEHDILGRVDQAIENWFEACECAAFEAPLSLVVVREALTGELDESGLAQRFLAGKVNFATLMPMRAIPFREVHLLGMNDGDYPRSRLPQDFDLMAGRGRAGDRSRRDDDRYLMLEAMLSARDRLSLSWVGRDQRDNVARPPSVLVNELLDCVALGWRPSAPAGDYLGATSSPQVRDERALWQRLVEEHPLQPFSARYFRKDSPFATYERSWEALHLKGHDHAAPAAPGVTLGPDVAPEAALGLGSLASLLRLPPRICIGERLGVTFREVRVPDEDAEPFYPSGLEIHMLKRELLDAGRDGLERQAGLGFDNAVSRLMRDGRLPALGFGEALLQRLSGPLTAQLARWQTLTAELEAIAPVRVVSHGAISDAHAPATGSVEINFEERLDGLTRDAAGRLWRWQLEPGHFGHFKLDREGRLAQWGKPRRLFAAWLAQQALAANGRAVHVGALFEDRELILPPPEAGVASQRLQGLLKLWWQARQVPMACAPELAFAWLAAQPLQSDEPAASEATKIDAGEMLAQARESARTRYEEGSFAGVAALRDSEPMLGELWPDFEALMAASFEPCARALYAPLWGDLIRMLQESGSHADD